MSRKTIYIMMGLQGSGKTTFCCRNLPDICRVNLDTLKTRKKEAALITKCQSFGQSYVVDNTNPTREDRARYISSAKANGYCVVGYFMQSRLKECIERNDYRTGKAKVPANAIAMTSNKLVLPDYSEGFDKLYFVSNDGNEMIISEWRVE